MLQPKSVGAVLLATVCVGVAAVGDSVSDDQKTTAPQARSVQAFERLKELVGDWQLTTPADNEAKQKIVARYRVSAAGSALVETLFPGEDKEMVTVIHRDGDQLLLTHYCCCGNQPRMRTATCDTKDELVFEFAGGSNLDPQKDDHMHSYRVRFIDKNRIRGEWEYYQGGKSGAKHVFDLTRKEH